MNNAFQATRYLSNRSTHIGCSIPVVTTIIADLKVTNKDFGIMAMKRGLKEAMEEKFKEMEYNEKFTIATFLDPRFKHKFFRYELLIQTNHISVIVFTKELFLFVM